MSKIVASQEMAVLRHLAAGGDKMADALVAVFDSLRVNGAEVVIARAASTANIASLSGALTVDGVALAVGDVVLVKNQTSDINDGLYVVQSGTWTRLLNFNGDIVLAPGMLVLVVSGTSNAGTQWMCTSTSTVAGTDHIIFSQITGSLSSGAVTAAKLDGTTVGARLYGTPTFSVAAEASGHIDTTITLKDIQGNALGAVGMATVWVSDAPGGALTSHTPTTAVQTGTNLNADVANKLFRILSTAAGSIVVRITDTGQSYYLNVAVGDQIYSSAVITLS